MDFIIFICKHIVVFVFVYVYLCIVSSVDSYHFGFIYIVFLRQRLRHYAQMLLSHKDNFDTYLFWIQPLEMRYNAVKFAYLVFFPFAVFFIIMHFQP